MRTELSANAQAILLLTAPLIAGRGKPSADPLTNGEYRRLARRLRELQREPAEIAEELQIPTRHIRRCLKRLVEEGVVEKLSRPIGYRFTASIGPLFDGRG